MDNIIPIPNKSSSTWIYTALAVDAYFNQSRHRLLDNLIYVSTSKYPIYFDKVRFLSWVNAVELRGCAMQYVFIKESK